jgi:hypothetical protein
VASRNMPWYIPRLRSRSKPAGGETWATAVVTASIPTEAVFELKLKEGDKASAVIEATGVMVGAD